MIVLIAVYAASFETPIRLILMKVHGRLSRRIEGEWSPQDEVIG
jgi:hypothetical protein